MASKINISASAARSFEGATKLRVRMVNGMVQVRPTDRIQGKYLPEGECLQTISYKRKGETVSGAVISNKLALEQGSEYTVVAAKYGWLALVPGRQDGVSLTMRVA